MSRKTRFQGNARAQQEQVSEGVRATLTRMAGTFEDLKKELDTLAEALVRNEEENEKLASRIGEIEGELADARAAVREKDERLDLAKAQNTKMLAVLASAHAALDPRQFVGTVSIFPDQTSVSVGDDPEPGEAQEAEHHGDGHGTFADDNADSEAARAPGDAVSVILFIEPKEMADLAAMSLARGLPGPEHFIVDLIRKELRASGPGEMRTRGIVSQDRMSREGQSRHVTGTNSAEPGIPFN